MTCPPDAFVVSTPLQRRAVTAPVRIELLEAFGALKSASIADLAARMGRRPDSLYYHVRMLTRAGLLVEAGTRKSGKRDEALYRPVASTIAIPARQDHRPSLDAARQSVRALLRLSHRECEAALERRDLAREGDARNFYMRRLPLCRDPATLAEINRLIDRIERLAMASARKHVDDGATVRCAITITLAPMSGRTGAASSKARHESRENR